MRSLRALRLLLGSSESIEDLQDLPAMEELSITQMRFLSQIGDLQRFPSLRVLSLCNQPRIEWIKTGMKNASLERVWLENLPNLESLNGLVTLSSLKSLAAIKIGLALDQIDTPVRLTHLFLHTGRLGDVDAIKDEVEMRGLAYAYYPGLHIAEK